MFLRRIIIPLLTLSIVFNTMAWAIDDCTWFTDISRQNTSQINTSSSENGSVKKFCNTYCIGWVQLLYVSFQTPFADVIAHYFDAPLLFSFYHSLQHNPPTAPPQA
ncbi:MAG TPA: hypothetical protein ENI98_08700 [Gammaproteobacteria bacterium]|nr:hypothetical protein [Gammaproteobacteria bacterium]